VEDAFVDLYLVRHAIAFDADPAKWPDDSKRPLTPEGQKRFSRAARGLRELVPDVDLVLSSPWLRAWQTAELLEADAGWPRAVACDALASGRVPAEVLQALQPFNGHATIALVGHEPSLHELASYLLTADTDAQIEMRKGGVARLEVGEGLRPGAGRLLWLLPPKVLRALAP
jgi:phosphohistidine phosphatase